MKAMRTVGVCAALVVAFLVGRLTNPVKVKAGSALSHIVHVAAPTDSPATVPNYDRAVGLSCSGNDCYVLVTDN